MKPHELTAALQAAKDLPALAKALTQTVEERAPEVTYRTYATPHRLDYMRKTQKGERP